MSGGDKTTTTSNSSNTPWAEAQPYMKDTLARYYQSVTNNPNAYATYTWDRVAAPSSTTNSAISADIRNANNLGGAVSKNMQETISQGGFNDAQLASMNYMGNAASDYNTGGYSAKNLGNMASGKLLGQGNPYLKDALAVANEQAATSINDAMSSAGRYGSGVHQSTLAKTLADQNTQAMFGQYNQDVANMVGANQQIDSMGLAAAGRRDANASNLFNAGQQGIANQANAYNAARMGADDLYRAGGQQDAYRQAKLESDMTNWYEGRDRTAEVLANANAIASGAGQIGSSYSASSTSNSPTNWTRIASGAAGSAISGKG